MVTRVIRFLSFEGCPLADDALARLYDAIDRSGVFERSNVELVDIMSPETPEALRRWGSPTILVDGRDLTGQGPGDAAGCRIYSGPGGLPTTEQIAEFLISTRSNNGG
jgi:hypothetical protein